MGTSLSWPGMHEGQVEGSSRAPSPPPPPHHSTQAKSWNEEPQGMRDHFVLSIPPPPPPWPGVWLLQGLQRMGRGV